MKACAALLKTWWTRYMQRHLANSTSACTTTQTVNLQFVLILIESRWVCLETLPLPNVQGNCDRLVSICKRVLHNRWRIWATSNGQTNSPLHIGWSAIREATQHQPDDKQLPLSVFNWASTIAHQINPQKAPQLSKNTGCVKLVTLTFCTWAVRSVHAQWQQEQVMCQDVTLTFCVWAVRTIHKSWQMG